VRKILDEVARGLTLNDAIAKVLPANRRSWALRRIPAYREQGVEGLIDARTPREPTVSRECAHAVQAARETNPRLAAAEFVIRDKTRTVLTGQGLNPPNTLNLTASGCIPTNGLC